MAYVFRRVQDALGNEREQKTDIFAATPGAEPTAGGEQVPGGVKTSTEGELGAGGMAATGGTGGEGAPTDVKTVDKALIQKNLGKTRAPRFAQEAQGTLTSADQQLQDEANKYVAGYQAKDYSVGADVLDKAIGGDADAMSTTTGRLGQAAERVDQFAPKTKYDYSDQIGEFKTDEGLKNIMRRESGPQYNAGEAAFDVMLLNRNADFQNIRSQLANQQSELLKRAGEMSGASGSKTKDAQAAVEANLGKAQTGIRDYLGTREKDMIAAQEQERAAENAALAELRKAGGGSYLSEQAAAELKKLQDEYAGADQSGAAGYLGKSGANAADYYSVRGDYDNYRDFIDANEASRFGNIYSLLGRSDDDSVKNAMAGGGTTARHGFDAATFRDAVVRGAERSNADADSAAQAELDRILGDVRGRYAGDQDNYLRSKARELDALVRGEYGDDYDHNVDAYQFKREQGGDLAGLSAADAARLNEMSRELGQGDAYSEGGGFGSSFDSDSYLNALRTAATNKRQSRVAAEAAQKERERQRADSVGTTAEGRDQAGVEDPGSQRTGTRSSNSKYVPDWVVSEGKKILANMAKADKATGGRGGDVATQARENVKTVDSTLTSADKATGGHGGKLKKSLCFPAGVRFRLEAGHLSPVEMLAVGDVLEQGGLITDRHFGVSDDMYVVNGVLLTGEHVMSVGGKWVEAQNVPGAMKVAGEFEVYNVTCENHVMIHETGAVLGDFDRDAEG
jgi:hypothetical protein